MQHNTGNWQTFDLKEVASSTSAECFVFSDSNSAETLLKADPLSSKTCRSMMSRAFSSFNCLSG